MVFQRKNAWFFFVIALLASLEYLTMVRTMVRIDFPKDVPGLAPMIPTGIANTTIISRKNSTHAAGRSILHVLQYGPPSTAAATQFNMICVSLFLHVRMKHPHLLKNTRCNVEDLATRKMAEVKFQKNIPQAFRSREQQLDPTQFEISTVIFTNEFTKAAAEQKKRKLRNQGINVGIVQDTETLAEIGISGMVKQYAEFFSLKPGDIGLMTTYFQQGDNLRQCCGMQTSSDFGDELLPASDKAEDIKSHDFCDSLDIDSLEKQYMNSELYKLLDDYEFMKKINRPSLVHGDLNGSLCSRNNNIVRKYGNTGNGAIEYKGISLNRTNVKVERDSKDQHTNSSETLTKEVVHTLPKIAQKHGLPPPIESSSGEPPFSPWVQDYISFHKSSIVDGKLRENARYIVYECKDGATLCGGAGDRLIGMIKMFYLAMCTRRVLLIDAPFPIPLTDVFSPAHIEWNASFPETLEYLQDMNSSSELRLREKLQGYRIPRTNGPPRKKGLDDVLKSSLMTEHLEKGHLSEMAGKISLAAAAREAFMAMFQFKRVVISRAEKLKAAAGISGPYLAMHIRKGDDKMGIGPNSFYRKTDDDAVLRCYRQMKASHPDAFEMAYLASDDVITKERIANRDPSVHFAQLRPFHIDKSARSFRAVDHATVFSGVIDTWAEMLVMAESTCLILSKSMFTFASLHMRDPQACAVSLDFCNDPDHRKGDKKYFAENLAGNEFVVKIGKNTTRL
ncbi:hypothetical protein ACHAW6_007986 [Cyclotella cf. meneghiniana]